MYSSVHAHVTLAMDLLPGTIVSVGVRYKPSSSSDASTRFAYEYEHKPLLEASEECIASFGSKEKHRVSCAMSALNALQSFNSLRALPGTWFVTVLDGAGLRYDSGVGFSVAALIAAARAVGDHLAMTPEKMHGWHEVT